MSSSSIEPETRFSGEPCFPHGIKNIFISGDASFGRNCVIFQQVTIGSNYLAGSKHLGAPHIGDDCFIGAGAIIIGGVAIGNSCRIGAGCTVFDDVPDNCVVVSERPRVIQRSKPTKLRYYNRRNGVWRYYKHGTWAQEQDAESISALENARNRSSGDEPTNS